MSTHHSAHTRKHTIMGRFITVLLICILSGAEVDLFTPSFPELQRVFDLSPFAVQLTLSVNFIAYCLCALFTGTLGDKFSKRSVMLWSLLLFVLGSGLCMLAQSFSWLIVGRLLQGMGISGPSVLGFVVLADDYAADKQPALMGALNGMITLAMALAPVVGSFMNYAFGWRANFIVLFGLGVICLLGTWLTIPFRAGDPSLSLSPRAYFPLLKNARLMTFVMSICFLVVPYWVFIGISPILYMQDMGISLREFGFYQGSLSFAFATVSLLSQPFLNRFGQRNCLLGGLFFCAIAMSLLVLMLLERQENPISITFTMLILAMGAVFPVNILYPLSLEVVPNSKARSAALITASRLLVTSLALQAVGYVYQGSFAPIGVVMVAALFLAFLLIASLLSRAWIVWPSRPLLSTPITP